MGIKVISLNIEGHKHLERVIPFLQAEKADIINLQEVFAVDIPVLEHALQMKAQFVPLTNVLFPSIHVPDALGEFGIAQLYGPQVEVAQSRYYVGDAKQKLPIFFEDENPNSLFRAVSWVRGKFAGKMYTVATTHFTWSPRGEATELQENNLQKMEKILQIIPDFVFTGDFNAPRGGKIFTHLAEKYTDNIPQDITTSLDGQFHKAGQLELMVDGFFSTPTYKVSGVEVLGGVSDHKAIKGYVERV